QTQPPTPLPSQTPRPPTLQPSTPWLVGGHPRSNTHQPRTFYPPWTRSTPPTQSAVSPASAQRNTSLHQWPQPAATPPFASLLQMSLGFRGFSRLKDSSGRFGDTVAKDWSASEALRGSEESQSASS